MHAVAESVNPVRPWFWRPNMTGPLWGLLCCFGMGGVQILQRRRLVAGCLSSCDVHSIPHNPGSIAFLNILQTPDCYCCSAQFEPAVKDAAGKAEPMAKDFTSQTVRPAGDYVADNAVPLTKEYGEHS